MEINWFTVSSLSAQPCKLSTQCCSEENGAAIATLHRNGSNRSHSYSGVSVARAAVNDEWVPVAHGWVCLNLHPQELQSLEITEAEVPQLLLPFPAFVLKISESQHRRASDHREHSEAYSCSNRAHTANYSVGHSTNGTQVIEVLFRHNDGTAFAGRMLFSGRSLGLAWLLLSTESPSGY